MLLLLTPKMEHDTYATGVYDKRDKLIQNPHYVLVAKVNNARLTTVPPSMEFTPQATVARHRK